MRFLLFAIFPLLLLGEEITLSFLKSKPAGIARDFYIWQFLDQDITPNEANEAYKLIHKMNTKIFGRYFKKTDNKTLSRRTICENMELQELLKQEGRCIGYGLKLSEAAKMSKAQLKKLAKKLKNDAPKRAKELEILSAKDPLAKLVDSQDAALFASIFEGVGSGYRLTHFNRTIPPKKLEILANQNNHNMGHMLRIIIVNPAFTHLQESLAKASEITNANSHTLFYLGLNALVHGYKEHAIRYFIRAKERASDPLFITRAIFWHYLASGDLAILEEVAKSNYPSIYSIYATQTLGIAPSFEIVREVANGENMPEDMPKEASWDIKDPFAWIALQKESTSASASLHSDATQPHLALLMQRESKFQKHFYIRPYREIFAPFSEEKQALLYAIAKQESHLIPTAISSSYALGMMQIMPFNVESIAKKLGENRALTDMFDPSINVRYAEIFLRDLVREFSHPLFIAYAYNGGPGFARRMLAQGRLFKKSRALDPWYSLEMVPYEESRYYGGRVLANYIIYQQSFGREINIAELLHKTLL
ncbi:MAG: lytic transglycosylase domain-containing protein [Wolinella sp.]